MSLAGLLSTVAEDPTIHSILDAHSVAPGDPASLTWVGTVVVTRAPQEMF